MLIAELKVVYKANYACYGVLKMHEAMKRRGWQIGREQTRRLMKRAGLRGVQHGKPVFTTMRDPESTIPPDLVNRHFHAALPNRLWVADITYVRTWAGFTYTAFVTDVATRRCRHSITLYGNVIQILMSWCIIPIEDRQYLSLAYTDRLVELGIQTDTRLYRACCTQRGPTLRVCGPRRGRQAGPGPVDLVGAALPHPSIR